jgi:hypothetical protein
VDLLCVSPGMQILRQHNLVHVHSSSDRRRSSSRLRAYRPSNPERIPIIRITSSSRDSNSSSSLKTWNMRTQHPSTLSTPSSPSSDHCSPPNSGNPLAVLPSTIPHRRVELDASHRTNEPKKFDLTKLGLQKRKHHRRRHRHFHHLPLFFPEPLIAPLPSQRTTTPLNTEITRDCLKCNFQVNPIFVFNAVLKFLIFVLKILFSNAVSIYIFESMFYIIRNYHIFEFALLKSSFLPTCMFIIYLYYFFLTITNT